MEDAAQRITQERDAFRADQFNHQGNADAHAKTTAFELWNDSEKTLHGFVNFAGSGGTFAGTMRGLRVFNPKLEGYLIEPEGAEVLSGKPVHNPAHPIQGGGYAMPNLSLLDINLISGFVSVSGDQARQTARDLARLEGIFAGFSAGANAAAALDLMRGPLSGSTVAIVICDSGLKYLSTDLWAQS